MSASAPKPLPVLTPRSPVSDSATLLDVLFIITESSSDEIKIYIYIYAKECTTAMGLIIYIRLMVEVHLLDSYRISSLEM